ncbi:MAG: hypothetical protein U0Y08_05745 [Bacteroidia bacterium]
MKKLSYLVLPALLIITSCKKDPEIIPGNTAMSDPTVSLTQIRQFVQKVYLSTIGITPSDSVMDAEIRSLAITNCSNDSKSALINKLISSPEALENYYEIRNQQLLDGASDEDIEDMITSIEADISDPANAVDVTRLQLELQRMQDLRDARQQFLNGTISLLEVEKRMTASRLFAWVNGSGDVWVQSVFSFFLLRMPTDGELENASTMMYGYPATLFLQTGTTDTDFLNIFFSSRSFYEGQVRELFRNLLYREPDSGELLSYTDAFSSHKNHITTMRKIFLSHEFLRGY